MIARHVSVLTSCIVCLAIATSALAQPKNDKADKPVTLSVAASDFQFQGDWTVLNEKGVTVLWGTPQGVKLAAATAVLLPRAGKYRLWVCARDFPNDRPGIRNFRASVAGKRSEKTFGTSGVEGYSWEDGGTFDLPAGPVLICLEDAKPFARAQGVILTTDEKYKPSKIVGPGGIRATAPLAISVPQPESEKTAEVTIARGAPALTLSNAHVQIDFVPATRGKDPTIFPRVKVKAHDRWIDLPQDPSAEGYFATCAPADSKMVFHNFYPTWTRATAVPVTFDVGGVSFNTIPGRITSAVWDAGTRHRFVPRRVEMRDNGVRMEFHPSPAGRLEAFWTLGPEDHAVHVTLSFIPGADGQVALGYELFARKDLKQVAELLLPMMFQRHRLPNFDFTLLDNVAPVPMALVQPVGSPAVSMAIIADPASIPFGWPDGRKPHYGLSIRDRSGLVQPSIWGPVIGTPAATAKANQKMEMRFGLILQDGDWYSVLRTAVDEVFAVRDYRSNAGTSLSDAALNMIDLLKDDQHGGWWERAHSFYQIESKNSGTQSSPMLLLSLYRLTGDKELYHKRVLPTLEFMLSRGGPHFSPVPEDTGPYPAGTMNGPVKLFGTTTYAGLWELAARRTPAFGEIALPENNVRPTAGYSHAQPFDEWLARYISTGDPKDLKKACELADVYVKDMMTNPPKKDLGPMPFFFIHFTPDWEGLLWLYDFTQKKEYLDAAAFGARQLMTGLWCHPQFPSGEVTIHPGGKYEDQHPHEWWRGAERGRLGYPRKPGDVQEKKVPGWLVSNVGIGFEQPSTVRASGDARLIYQMYWAPHFLRLYRYTGDKAFLTCARNAVIGRFANYPGYYITGHTDLPLSPTYPLTGPDVTDIYYHHIPPHLAWTIDYLVSEAEMLSQGRIRFPALRQYGYAYFDSRVFGHAAGKVYDDEAAWLIFRRGLVALDNPQINCLTAQGSARFHVILTNQSQQAQEVNLTFSQEQLHFRGTLLANVYAGSDMNEVRMPNGKTKLTIPGRGLVVLSVHGAKVDAAGHPQPLAKPRAGESIVTAKSGPVETRAAAIQVDPGPWDAYFWVAASPKQVQSVTLRYTLGKKWESIRKDQYPFEFSVPVPEEKAPIWYRMDITHANGTVTSTIDAKLQLEK